MGTGHDASQGLFLELTVHSLGPRRHEWTRSDTKLSLFAALLAVAWKREWDKQTVCAKRNGMGWNTAGCQCLSIALLRPRPLSLFLVIVFVRFYSRRFFSLPVFYSHLPPTPF